MLTVRYLLNIDSIISFLFIFLLAFPRVNDFDAKRESCNLSTFSAGAEKDENKHTTVAAAKIFPASKISKQIPKYGCVNRQSEGAN